MIYELKLKNLRNFNFVSAVKYVLIFLNLGKKKKKNFRGNGFYLKKKFEIDGNGFIDYGLTFYRGDAIA